MAENTDQYRVVCTVSNEGERFANVPNAQIGEADTLAEAVTIINKDMHRSTLVGPGCYTIYAPDGTMHYHPSVGMAPVPPE